MPYKCIAVDDELPALELIKNYAARLPEIQLLHVFSDAVSAAEFLRCNAVDLLLLDINMPDINGIDLLNSLEKKPLVIFTTAYKKFAYEGFELEATDYLLKPIAFDRFKKGINKAVEALQQKELVRSQPGDTLFVRSEYKMVKIYLNQVEYIEGLEDYIKIHINGSRPVLTLLTMKACMEKLSSQSFLRIHRSYIIPFSQIDSVVNRKVLLRSGKQLPVSETYFAALNERINHK